MIEKTKNCIYCGALMESITAKKRYCSPLHKLYYNREIKRGTFKPPIKDFGYGKVTDEEKKQIAIKKPIPKTEVLEPEIIKDYDYFFNQIRSLEEPEDCKDWVFDVRASDLPQWRKTLLEQRLAAKWQ